jgi:3-phenylpropionate/trans-cinnamate dioxygenase ferredoxin subunit
VAELDVGPVEELPPGSVKIVVSGSIAVGVYNLNGEFDPEEGYAICPRHGARIDIRTGRPLTLPAVFPVETFPVRVEDGIVKVDVS